MSKQNRKNPKTTGGSSSQPFGGAQGYVPTFDSTMWGHQQPTWNQPPSIPMSPLFQNFNAFGSPPPQPSPQTQQFQAHQFYQSQQQYQSQPNYQQQQEEEEEEEFVEETDPEEYDDEDEEEQGHHQGKGKAAPKRWSNAEEICLAKAWCDISEDGQVGNECTFKNTIRMCVLNVFGGGTECDIGNG